MTPPIIFLYGVLGSFTVELIACVQAYEQHPNQLPRRYTKPGFWITRTLLALTAGTLATAYEIHTPLLAINVGASAPLLFRALGRGIK